MQCMPIGRGSRRPSTKTPQNCSRQIQRPRREARVHGSENDMSNDDLTKKLGALARERGLETEAWWDAAERADASRIPGPPPSIEAIRPLDQRERAAMTDRLFGPMNVVPMRGPRRHVR